MKVIIFGASGETGRSIVKALVASATQFVCFPSPSQTVTKGGKLIRGIRCQDITAVSREASLNSKNNDELRKLGVQVVAADLRGPVDDLVSLLKGADVVISSINATALLDQIPLVDAAKKAGVGRFIPCTFATASPPTGVMVLRETVSRNRHPHRTSSVADDLAEGESPQPHQKDIPPVHHH